MSIHAANLYPLSHITLAQPDKWPYKMETDPKGGNSIFVQHIISAYNQFQDRIVFLGPVRIA